MKSKLLLIYLVLGITICGWFTIAAAYRWKATDYGILRELSKSSSSGGGSGRSYGGSWGGGK